MKAVLKHLFVLGVIQILALIAATLLGEIYRLFKYPNVPKQEVLDFTIGFIFLVTFLGVTGTLSGVWT